jgi:hypothetical protein
MPDITTALQIRNLYVAHKLPYTTARAQLCTFCSMGDHEADLFLASEDTTGNGTIYACINGQISPSNAVRALKAIGIPADVAKARIQAAWKGKK